MTTSNLNSNKLVHLLFKKGMVVLFIAGFLTSRAQTFVSTQPQNKKALIEHLYGAKCYWSAQADSIADGIKASHAPGDVQLVNIHCLTGAGAWATPAVGLPDFITADGNSIAAMQGMATNYIPCGPVNRHPWVSSTSIILDRWSWEPRVDTILSKPAYVNVAAQATLDGATRVMTIQTEVYYTGNSPSPTNSLSVMLLEDSVLAYQAGNYYKSNRIGNQYYHNNMLRKCITPALGKTISNTSANSFVAQTFTYFVPTSYGSGTYTTAPVLKNLKIVVFVAENKWKVQNVSLGKVTLKYDHFLDAAISAVKSPISICSSFKGFAFTLKNNGQSPLSSVVLSIVTNNNPAATFTWTGNLQSSYSVKDIEIPPSLFVTPVLQSNVVALQVISVNGVTDDNATNDVLTSPNVPEAGVTNSPWLIVNFWQDQFGSESSWKMYEEGAEIVLVQGGPYSNLSTYGSTVHQTYFTVTPGKCYRMEVEDTGGNGISSGSGNGYYQVVSSTGTLWTSTGMFGSKEISSYRTSAITGIVDLNSSDGFSFFPNPANDFLKINVPSQNYSDFTVEIYDQIGRKVFNGQNQDRVDLSALEEGIYTLRISNQENEFSKKLCVTR